MTVDFKFEIDDKVFTPVNDASGNGIGIITNMSIDNSRDKQVYVQTAVAGNWWREDQVKLL